MWGGAGSENPKSFDEGFCNRCEEPPRDGSFSSARKAEKLSLAPCTPVSLHAGMVCSLRAL